MKEKSEIKEFEPYEEILLKMKLFKGIEKENLRPLILLLGGRECVYEAKDTIWKAHSKVGEMGIVLNGSIQAEDPTREEGQIIQRFSACHTFGEAIAFGKGVSWVNIKAAQDCRVLFISAEKVSENQMNPDVVCLMANLLKEFSTKLALMTLKNQILSEPRVRNKLLMYLSTLDTDENGFKTVPFLQKDLAHYLNVNKSAFNREIAKMKSEGLIEICSQKVRVNKENQN